MRDFVAYLFEANMRFFEVAANWVLGLEVDWLKTRAAIWKKTLFSIEMDVGSLWTTKPTAGAQMIPLQGVNWPSLRVEKDGTTS